MLPSTGLHWVSLRLTAPVTPSSRQLCAGQEGWRLLFIHPPPLSVSTLQHDAARANHSFLRTNCPLLIGLRAIAIGPPAFRNGRCIASNDGHRQAQSQPGVKQPHRLQGIFDSFSPSHRFVDSQICCSPYCCLDGRCLSPPRPPQSLLCRGSPTKA